MRNRFARFMYGRYGVDALNNFLFGLYVALFVLELFFRRTVAGQVMVILGYPIIRRFCPLWQKRECTGIP